MASLILTAFDFILGGFVGAVTIALACLVDVVMDTGFLASDREVGR